MFCYAGTGAERAQETLDVTSAELVRLAEGIEEHELDRLKARIKSALIMQQESSSARSSSIARDWYHLGRARTLDEVGRLIDGLTLPQHQRLPGRASAAAISRWSRSVRASWRCPVEFLSHVLAQRPGDRRRVQRRGLFHGAGVLRQHRRPRRDRRGGRREPFPRAHGLQGHAPRRSADDVNREFDEMGAHYNAFTNEENTVYYAAVLPEYQDRAVGTAGRHPPARRSARTTSTPRSR